MKIIIFLRKNFHNSKDDQPWILKIDGKTEKKFRGVRRGGVNAYASYYIFTQNPDGRFDATPLNEWYDFQPSQRYKALSAEEADKEFGRRNKIMNYFSLMTHNRLHEADEKAAKIKSGKEFTICDDEDVFMVSISQCVFQSCNKWLCVIHKKLKIFPKGFGR